VFDMIDSLAAAADAALEAALQASGARDPREFYRERLRELKRLRPHEYDSAAAYYTETLIPQVARGEREPLEAWTEYGRRLAVALAPGRTVGIDETGSARPWEGGLDRLVLHLPDENGARALLVGLPPQLSDAQRATYDVLVAGKQRFGAGEAGG
jgi:hypothetical protein